MCKAPTPSPLSGSVLNAASETIEPMPRWKLDHPTAITCGIRKISYPKINRRVNRFGNALKAKSLAQDRCAQISLNETSALIAG